MGTDIHCHSTCGGRDSETILREWIGKKRMAFGHHGVNRLDVTKKKENEIYDRISFMQI